MAPIAASCGKRWGQAWTNPQPTPFNDDCPRRSLSSKGSDMSFRIFIYYCALCGGWAAFLGWAVGLFLSPSAPLGNVGIRGMWLGMFVAFGLGLVDALWNLSLTQAHVIGM